MLTYEQPTPALANEVAAFMALFREAGETVVNGSVGLDFMGDYTAWLGYLERLKSGAEEGLGLGPTDVYFARDASGAMAGIFDIRAALPENMRQWGHLGYSVAPAFRGRGHAPEMVRCALSLLRGKGVCDVLAATYEDNTASQRVLAKCGFLPTGSYTEPGSGKIIINYTNSKEKEHANG